MATDDLLLTDVDELIDALADAGVTAHLDYRDVRPPSVWVQFLGPAQDGTTLGGAVTRLVLYPVVAANTSVRRELEALAELWNTIRPVVQYFGGPSGDVTTTGLILGTASSGTPQPAFRVPLDLITINEGESP